MCGVVPAGGDPLPSDAEIASPGDSPMRVVLFDVDGVLLNSWATHMRIWRSWSEYHDFDFDSVWAATHGRRIVETLADIAPHLDPQVEEARIHDIMLAQTDAFPAMPGAAALLASLPAGRWAIVTSAKGENVRHRFRIAGLPIPRILVDNGAVSNGKPDPEGYLAGAQGLDASPGDCLVVEDAPAGVAAGKAAGMTVLALATTHTPQELAAADRRIGSLTEGANAIHAWLRGDPLTS